MNLPRQSLPTTVHATSLAKEVERIKCRVVIICICEDSFFTELADFFANALVCESLCEIELVVLLAVGP